MSGERCDIVYWDYVWLNAIRYSETCCDMGREWDDPASCTLLQYVTDDVCENNEGSFTKFEIDSKQLNFFIESKTMSNSKDFW